MVADPPANAAVPTFTGTPTQGNTLTLDTGTWTGTAPIDFDVVWQRCDLAGDNCVAIPGATGTTYTLTGDDVDATIRALVTASNAGGVAGATSVPSATVTVGRPPTPRSRHHRHPVEGETLTADDGGWTGTQPLTFTYQWRRCDELGDNCVNIAGATDPAYTLTGDDVGVIIRVLVTAANDAGTASAASSAGRGVAPRRRSTPSLPTVSGTAESGRSSPRTTALDRHAHRSPTPTSGGAATRGRSCADIAGATSIRPTR